MQLTEYNSKKKKGQLMKDIGNRQDNKKVISLPHGNETLEVEVPDRIIFDGAMQYIQPVNNLEELLWERIKHPVGCETLGEMVSPGEKILILIEDNTRNTPVKKILPVLIDYLKDCGIGPDNLEILAAPGTHRLMTESELNEKVGEIVASSIKISQHDFADHAALIDLGRIRTGTGDIPIQVNKKAIDADFIIGLGNIVPHCDAGFSGGAKIVQPGICGYPTTAATHVAAALLEKIPLGCVENPCRWGMEKVAKRVGLRFIINTIMNFKNEVIDIVTGDFIKAHRKGAKVAEKAFGVKIPELADIVIVSSHPADIDYWQAEKGITSAYFTVKENGFIIFVAPCPEGLEHNHPKFREWLKMSYSGACDRVKNTSVCDETADLVSADLAIANSRAREKVTILAVSQGLEEEDFEILGYRPFKTIQTALDFALAAMPDGTIGILPRGGDCLPVLDDTNFSHPDRLF
ncbi:MAG: nickel-dependent lactate racemase [Desulfobacterales bacterium]